MAVKFGLRRLASDPTVDAFDPLTLADATVGAGAFAGIDKPARVHLVGSYTLDPVRQAAYVPLALAAGQTVALDVDLTPGNLRMYVLDPTGTVVRQNDDSGVVDSGSPGTLDPSLVFGPPTGGLFYVVVTSFDNAYLGNWQFENDGTVTGSFQLDISGPPLPSPANLGDASDDFFGNVDTSYRVRGQGGDDRIWLFGTNDDTVTGGEGADDLDGGPGNDVIVGGVGSDSIEGGLGRDVLVGGDGIDSLFGEEGNDLLFGGKDGDHLDGGNGNDRIFSGPDDFVRGGAGDDTIVGGDYAEGGDGNDVLSGDRNDNWILGGQGSDQIFGAGGNDRLEGGNGNDTIDGGTGLDLVVFDPNGNGVVVDLTAGTATGQGADTLFEIEGIFGTARSDTIRGNSGGNVIFGFDERDFLNGEGGNDQIFGDDGNDLIGGGDDNDSLDGNEGNDILGGEQGRDVLDGGAGSDRLYGGTGRDVLTGGTERDFFIFVSKAEAGLPGPNSDLVADFNSSESDKIVLRDIDANEFEDGDQEFSFIGNEAFTGMAGQLHYLILGGDLRIEGDTNGDLAADFEITLRGVSAVTAGDFGL
jgi:Ca2+-binding RTX toxin-like protein